MGNCCFGFNSRLFNFGGGEEFIEVANYAALPATGDTSVIYVTLDDNKLYRWTGSTYVELSGMTIDANPTDGSANAVSSNGAFDALALKQDTLVSGTNIKTINGSSLLGGGDLAIIGGWGLTGNAGTNPVSDYIGTTDSQPLVFKTGGNERLRILANGNVGIGTTAPNAPFHLKKDFAASWGQFALQSDTGVGNATIIYESYYDSVGTRLASFGLGHYLGGNDPNYYFANEVANGGIRFRNSTADIFTIHNNGNVGIGTNTDAGYKLDVSGKTRIQGQLNLKNYTVATLPTPTRGDTCYVTDALAPAIGSTVVGGGAIAAMVWYNGTAWTVTGI